MDVVPLYGDMQMKPYFYITKSLNFDSSRWSHCESSSPSPQSQILTSVETFRESHIEYVSELARRNNEVTPPPSPSCRCLISLSFWLMCVACCSWTGNKLCFLCRGWRALTRALAQTERTRRCTSWPCAVWTSCRHGHRGSWSWYSSHIFRLRKNSVFTISS